MESERKHLIPNKFGVKLNFSVKNISSMHSNYLISSSKEKIAPADGFVQKYTLAYSTKLTMLVYFNTLVRNMFVTNLC
jgi:hypothetical protein